jgi:hypothetical protein
VEPGLVVHVRVRAPASSGRRGTVVINELARDRQAKRPLAHGEVLVELNLHVDDLAPERVA